MRGASLHFIVPSVWNHNTKLKESTYRENQNRTD